MKYDTTWEERQEAWSNAMAGEMARENHASEVARAKEMDSRELRREYMERRKEGPYALAEWLGVEKVTPQMRELWDYIADEDMGEEIAEAYLRKGGDEYECYIDWIKEEKLPYADD